MHGVDRTRRILASSQTSTVSDFLITRDGVEIKLELLNDYTGYWRRYNVLHLRDFKFNQLKKSSAVLICISVPTGEFALYDFNEDIRARYMPSHRPYGGKPAYEIGIQNEMIEKIGENNIQMAIIEIFDRRRA